MNKATKEILSKLFFRESGNIIYVAKDNKNINEVWAELCGILYQMKEKGLVFFRTKSDQYQIEIFNRMIILVEESADQDTCGLRGRFVIADKGVAPEFACPFAATSLKSEFERQIY